MFSGFVSLFRFIKSCFASKYYWFIVLGGTAVCTAPMLVVLAIVQVPEFLWPLRLVGTVLITSFWGLFAGLKEWYLHKKKELEWHAGKERERRIPPR